MIGGREGPAGGGARTIPENTPEKEIEKALQRKEVVEEASCLTGRDRSEFLAERGVSTGSYHRWKRELELDGFAALVRKPRSDRGQWRKLPPEVIEVIKGKWLDPSRPSASDVYRAISKLWPEIFGLQRQAGMPAKPSYATVLKALHDIPRPAGKLARKWKKHYGDQGESIILREPLTVSGGHRTAEEEALNKLSGEIMDAAMAVHQEMGPGLREALYEKCLAKELKERGIKFKRQAQITVPYKGEQLDGAFWADILVENLIVVEIKAVKKITDDHERQIRTYLKLSSYPMGFLLNFNSKLMKNGIRWFRF